MIKDFFASINTEEKAYWLGFLYADGCVSKDLKFVILDLNIKDYLHVQKFCKAIEASQKIKIHGEKNQYCRATIGSVQMCKDLNNKGCTPHKSLTLKFPDEKIVPNRFRKDFVRGYFDGDGCLSFSSTYQHRSDCNPNKLYKRTHWLFKILGTESFLQSLADFLPVETHITHGGKNIFQIKCGGNQKIKDIMNSFYSIDDKIFLDRKMDKYKQLLNYK